MTRENEREPVRLDSLTGLRFFAALVVFASHAAVLLGPRLSADVSFLTEQGFVGVSFFYILSGFVLTWSHRDGDTPSAFYRRRFARIAPNYWICLALGVLYGAYASGNLLGTAVDSSPSALALQAWVPSDSVYYAGNPVGWSISVEMFFYALFPLLVLATRSRGRLLTLAVVGAAIVVATPLLLRPTINVHDVSFWAVYILPAQRLGEFVLGIALAAAMLRGWRSPVGVPVSAALAVAAYVVAGFVPFWAAVAMVTLVPFTLLIAAGASSDLAGRSSALGRRALVRLGEWSFAFYLIHVLVVASTQSVIKRLPASMSVSDSFGVAAAVFALVASVVAAALLYRVVEHPMERRLRHARPRLSEVGADAS